MKYLFILLSQLLFFVTQAQTPNWLWAKKAGGTGWDNAVCMKTDLLGNMIVVGQFLSSSINFSNITLNNTSTGGLGDAFLAKYDANGNTIWVKSIGSVGHENISSVCTDMQGNIFVIGYFTSPAILIGGIQLTNTTSGGGAPDAFVAKYDANGTALWANKILGTNQDEGNAIDVDFTGNIVVGGYFWSSSLSFGATTISNSYFGTTDIFLAKYNTNGGLIWAKGAGGNASELLKSLSFDNNGDIVAVGMFPSDTLFLGGISLVNSTMGVAGNMFTVKYDTNGNPIWAKSAFGAKGQWALSVDTDLNGNIVTVGYFDSLAINIGGFTFNNQGNSDGFMVKYDSNGNVIWAKSFGGTGQDYANSVHIQPNGKILIGGYFRGSSITLGSTNLTRVGNHDCFIAKYDTNGNEIWAFQIGGMGSDIGSSLTTDMNNNIFWTGSYGSQN